jgi:hypothetical protein
MKINKAYIAVGLIIAFTLFFEIAAHADEVDQATTITFSQPIRIPGRVLAAGTYLFKTVDADSGEHVVQIFSLDRSVLYGTFLTVSVERQEPVDHTVITVAEPETGEMPVLVDWFYPGRDIGNQFVYSKQTEKELGHVTVASNQTSTSTTDVAGGAN